MEEMEGRKRRGRYVHILTTHCRCSLRNEKCIVTSATFGEEGGTGLTHVCLFVSGITQNVVGEFLSNLEYR